MITIYALFNIVLEPVRESGLVPAKEIRATDLPDDFAVSAPVVWNVIVVCILTKFQLDYLIYGYGLTDSNDTSC
jgi:hypothetical protein